MIANRLSLITGHLA